MAEAAVWLGLVRLGLTLLSFRRLVSVLGLSEVATDHRPPESPQPYDAGASAAVGNAIGVAARRTPWNSTCLIQSLAGHEMLRRRHVSSVVHLGVAKGRSGDLVAHSWLDSGGSVITGAHAHGSFSPIAVLVSSRRAS